MANQEGRIRNNNDNNENENDDRNDNDNDSGNNDDTDTDATETRELEERTNRSASVLLDRLVSHLSRLPEHRAGPATANAEDTAGHETRDEPHDNSNARSDASPNPDENADADENADEDGNADADIHARANTKGSQGNTKPPRDTCEECEASFLVERGMTLPVAAVAWLSRRLEELDRMQQQQQQQQQQRDGDKGPGAGQHGRGQRAGGEYPAPVGPVAAGGPSPEAVGPAPWNGPAGEASLRSRLNLVRGLLPRVGLVRLNRRPWPPPLSSSERRRQRLKQWWRTQRQGQPRRAPSRSNSNSNDDDDHHHHNNNQNQNHNHNDDDDDTLDNPAGTGGSPKYRVRLDRVFPNANVLLLEGVPPSWIDMNTNETRTTGTGAGGGKPTSIPNDSARGARKSPLRVFAVRKAAIYDPKEFLAPDLSTTGITHLTLEGCSLGELTRGFSQALGRLKNLEYLSLRHNEFRNARSLLGGLRPLTRLKYLDASHNRLEGCFGPFANLCLGGQVRTLLLSHNLLATCRNSGLEKCFGLLELWLDGNNIGDVLEVSGLAGLPELGFLALHRNPFSTKPPSPPAGRRLSLMSSASSSASQKTDSGEQTTDPCYDPEWKIRLWAWFKQERRASTPLELPLLNQHKRFAGRGASSGAPIGRMTRDEWNRVQKASFSPLEPPARAVSASSSDASDSVTLSEPLARAAAPVLWTSPACNPKATKTSRTRRAKIRDGGTTGTGRGNDTRGSQRERLRGRRRRTTPKSKPPRGQAKNELSGPSGAVPPDKTKRSVSIGSPETKKNHQLSFSLEDVLLSIGQQDDFFGKDRSLLGANEIEFQSLHPDDLHIPQKYGSNNPNNPFLTENDTVPKDGEKSIYAGKEEGNNDEPSSIPVPKNPNNPFATEDDSAPEDEGNNDEPSSIPVPENPNNPFATEDDEVPQDEETSLDACKAVNNNGESLSIPVPIEDGEKPEGSNSSLCSTTFPPKNAEDRSTKSSEHEHENCDTEGSNDCKSTTTDEASNTKSGISSRRSSPRRSPRRAATAPTLLETASEDRIFVKPRVATVKLQRMGKHKPFDALITDWEELVTQASEGRIPDGLLKAPLLTTREPSDEFGMPSDGHIFTDKETDLLESKSVETIVTKAKNATNPATASASTSGDGSLSLLDNRVANSLPEHVWKDDGSVLSSLGASRDGVVAREKPNKFQLAEENCSYDGPDSSRGMKVFENLELYFESFVFPKSAPDLPIDVLEEMEEDEDDWQLVTMCHPRIQLWPDDRRLLEKTPMAALMENARIAANRERFCRVWEEEVVPCGRPALRRLPPNRRIRLGFHGDRLFEDANVVDAYSECRRVLLCLSSKALYVMPDRDEVTANHQQLANKKGRFPLPLDRRDRFRDAPWPHAVARHSFGDLEAICIGFEFQRLTLRFRNPGLPGSDPFVYVLLSGEKRATVRILSEIQKLAKDWSENRSMAIGRSPATNLERPSVSIENDADVVMDGLGGVLEKGRAIGTILHFQILRQQWKHGDRGTVRRVLVITETMLLLLDEDYVSDGHDLSEVSPSSSSASAGERRTSATADAGYRLVDDAGLSLVSEVLAAGSDPRAITIVIKPPSKLSRTRRWRLVCRDREGAEKLVEDARKALERFEA